MFIVGIDIAKRSHEAIIIAEDGQVVRKAFSFRNNCTGYNLLLEQVRKLTLVKSQIVFAMESTAHYWLALYARLLKDGYTVMVLNPIQSHSLRELYIRKAKTDARDSLVIADLVRFGRCKASNVPQDKILALRELCRSRAYLVDMAADLKRKLIALLDRIFPEYESLFDSVFSKASIAVLSKYSTPQKVKNANLRKLTDILMESSNGHFGEWKAHQLKEAACSSFGIDDSGGVTSIESYAFEDCNNLKEVHITDIAAWCKINFGLYGSANPLYCAHNLYVNGILVTDLAIPDGVTSIGPNAFCGYTGSSVMIPNSVTSIGKYAFDGCSGLTSVTIPNSVTSIGRNAFYHCTGLTNVTIPNSVTSIGPNAFCGCSSMTSVMIPSSVTSIGIGVFADCSGLTSVTIPNSVTSIETGAFYHCTGLTNVTIPNSVTHIGNYAFRGCSSLTSVTIPNSVTSIRPYAFSDCSSLTSVTIPNSVTSIMYRVFYNCSSLTSVTIPNSVTSIESEFADFD